MDTNQSFVFQTNNTTTDSDDHHNQSAADQLIKQLTSDHHDLSNVGELPASEFLKWGAYVNSSQPSTPSSTTDANAELTQNLLASLMNNSKNLICDIGV